jgi:hypothetical protein
VDGTALLTVCQTPWSTGTERANITDPVFEIRPLWVPSLDGRLISALIFLETKSLAWFEHMGIVL